MVLEPDIGRRVNMEAEPRRGVDTRQCANKNAGLEGGWIVRSHVSWGGDLFEIAFTRVWKHILSRRRVLKTLKGSLKQKAQRGQYLLAVGLDC